MKVKNEDIIKVHYTGKFENGDIFDSSLERDPLIFQTGVGMMIPGFDKGVIGMEVGEKRQISVPPEDGYGDVDPNRIIEMGKDKFPEGHTPEVGMQMELVDQHQHAIPATIKEIKEDSVILDANHPLAGKSVVFDVELLEIGCELPDHYHHHHGCGCDNESEKDCDGEGAGGGCGSGGCCG